MGAEADQLGFFFHTHRRCFVGGFTDGEIRAEGESDAPALSTRADATEGQNHTDSHLGFSLAFHALQKARRLQYNLRNL